MGTRARDASSEIVIGVLPGEGIGAEIVQSALEVLQAVADVTGLHVLTRTGGPIGRDAERACGHCLSPDVSAFCRRIFAAGGAVLNGPGGGRYVYDLRKQFDLFFKISPIQQHNGAPGASRLLADATRDVDILLTRENTGGVYQGEWRTLQDGEQGKVAEHAFTYSEMQVRRFLQASARLAQMRRSRLTVVWKESGIPGISALWKACAAEAAEACGVEWAMVDVDLMAYRLIQEASAFDVIAAPNLLGDVLADLGAVLLGARGVTYSGNFNAHREAVYQTNHGAAYELSGTDQANPVGQILSLAMMLRESFGLKQEANAIEEGVHCVWRSGWCTADALVPGGIAVGTRELTARIAEQAAAIAGQHSAK